MNTAIWNQRLDGESGQVERVEAHGEPGEQRARSAAAARRIRGPRR